MNYTPNSEEQIKEMLTVLGLEKPEDLFVDIPEHLKCGKLDLPPALRSEARLIDFIEKKSACNPDGLKLKSYLGAGTYDHYVPALVDSLSSRGEFFTAYTPYQPEVSQGTLQTIFEYQSMVCELFGMDVSNASGYDAGTCLADAVLVASRVKSKAPRVLIAAGVHPEYIEVVKTYADGLDLVVLPSVDGAGTVDMAVMEKELESGDVCAVCVQSPNFFGCVEPMAEIGKKLSDLPALFITVSNPLALGLFESPGTCGADIAVGDGQVLGNYMAFGGPHLGIYTCKESLVRRMPGRVVGKTTDKDGKPAYVMTLRTREQDIRREKATSNICSNQALVALRSSMYMTWLGKNGIQELADQNYRLAHYLKDQLVKVDGIEAAFSSAFFNEFTVTVPDVDAFVDKMLDAGIMPGVSLKRFDCGQKNGLLIAVTEKKTVADLDDFVLKAKAVLEAGKAGK